MEEIEELRDLLASALHRITKLEEQIKVLENLHWCRDCKKLLVESNHVLDDLCTDCEIDSMN